MSLITRIFDKKGMPVLSVVMVVLLVAESRHRLRRRTQPKIKRQVTNSLISIPSFVLLRLMFLPAMVLLAKKNQQWKLGLPRHIIKSRFAQAAAAFLIMDYTNYLWHVINHKIPFLWRFHVVHHSDHDLDLSTAFRFHFGEMIGSLFYRGFFVLLSGASPVNVLLYEVVFEGATEFHHSNTKLPLQVEQALGKLIVTPRMHSIHHSIYKNETDSNYSVIFSMWDRLHKTLQLDIPQELLTIGVPAYPNADELTVQYLLKMPFGEQRKWPIEFEARARDL